MKRFLQSIGIIIGVILSSTLVVQAGTVLFPYGGGTGTSTVPTYGQVLVGNTQGTYTPTATTSIGIISSQWTTNGSSIYYNGGKVGIASTTPWAELSINPNGISGPVFSVGSSTATKFLITNGGKVGIGTKAPANTLDVQGGISSFKGTTATYPVYLADDVGASNITWNNSSNNFYGRLNQKGNGETVWSVNINNNDVIDNSSYGAAKFALHPQADRITYQVSGSGGVWSFGTPLYMQMSTADMFLNYPDGYQGRTIIGTSFDDGANQLQVSGSSSFGDGNLIIGNSTPVFSGAGGDGVLERGKTVDMAFNMLTLTDSSGSGYGITFNGANMNFQSAAMNFQTGSTFAIRDTPIPSHNLIGNDGASGNLDFIPYTRFIQTDSSGNAEIGTTTPNATLYTYGSIGSNPTNTATSYTIATSTDNYIRVTNTSSARTITLPLCNGKTLGNQYTVKDTSGGAGTNNITVQGNGSDLIDGASTKVINTNYGHFMFKCGVAGMWDIN